MTLGLSVDTPQTDIGLKECVRCGVAKAPDRFGFDKRYNKLMGTCRTCRAHGSKVSHEKHRIERNQKHKEYCAATPRHAMLITLQRKYLQTLAADLISISELMEIWRNQKGRCALSGIEMTWIGGGGKPTATSLSLDRINQKKGYVSGNVRLLCFSVNSFRGRLTDLELFRLVEKLYGQMKMLAIGEKQ